MTPRRNNRFARRSGCYRCTRCGKQTRQTGHDEESVTMCAFCYQLCGLENMLADGLISDGVFDVKVTALEEKYHRSIELEEAEADLLPNL